MYLTLMKLVAINKCSNTYWPITYFLIVTN